MINNSKLPENLKAYRRTLNLTQGEVAEIISKDRSSVAKYESGKAVPPFSILRLLAKLYDVTIDQLCGLESPTLVVNSETEESENNPLSKFSKQEQLMILKFKTMDEDKKLEFMEALKDFLKD